MFKIQPFYLSTVGTILEKYPETRNDDKLLFTKFIKHYYKDKLSFFGHYVSLDCLAHLPSATMITRTRAYIQNQLGMYEPTISSAFLRRKNCTNRKK